jgi:hypothetical protein
MAHCWSNGLPDFHRIAIKSLRAVDIGSNAVFAASHACSEYRFGDRAIDSVRLRRCSARVSPALPSRDDAECAKAALFLVSAYAGAVTDAALDVNGGEFLPR